MGGRQFDVCNRAAPACVERMAQSVPACFEARVWRIYLVDHYRGTLNDPAARARMNRGETPDFCSDCTREHALAMSASMRCRPPMDAITPFTPPPIPEPEQEQLAFT